jgi:hypothetical protein
MDAALKVMFALRKTGDQELATLKDSRSGNRYARKSRSALGNRVFSAIKRWYEPAAKMRNFCESVGLASLVHGDDRGSFVHCESVGFEVPLRVGGSGSGFREQIGKCRAVADSDVLAEIGPDVAWEIESGRIAFVQRHDLRGGCMVGVLSHHSSKQKTTTDQTELDQRIHHGFSSPKTICSRTQQRLHAR